MIPELDELAWQWGGIVGLNPMDLSLRELGWAMRARQKAEWDRTANVMAWFAAKLTGENVDPTTLNPFAPKPKRDPKAESKQAFANIKAGLKALAKKGKKRGSGKRK